MIEQVRRTLADQGFLRAGDTLLVAFSGGPDSSALLHVLCELAPDLGIAVVAAHVDHRQRADSQDDSTYCRRVAKRLGLAVVTEVLPPGRKSEAQLRELRYESLARTATMVGADAVATGHTANDRAETFVLNLLRGSGSQGLGALPFATLHHGVKVIRPLIEAERADVLSYLTSRGLKWLEDPTNRDTRLERNHIRAEVLPLLETVRPGALRAIARAAELLTAESDYLRAVARTRVARAEPGAPVPLPARLHPAIARLVVREAVRAALGDLADVGFPIVDKARELFREATRDGRPRHVALPGRHVLEITRAGIRVVPGFRGRPSEKPRTTRKKSIS